jgi:hypothetical protein
MSPFKSRNILTLSKGNQILTLPTMQDHKYKFFNITFNIFLFHANLHKVFKR